MDNVIIFGAALNGLRIKRYLESKSKYKICYFSDNNEKKWNLIFDGIEIISMDSLISLFRNGFKGCIVIAINELNSVVDQIRASGIATSVFGITKTFLNKQFPVDINPEELLYSIDYGKPRFDYFEYHVADHCNLRCKGCGHLSNIAEPRFGDFWQYEKDIRRLKELFWGIKRIRLMGGEPLLNPQLPEFVKVTRSVFRDANIRVVTNGLLIPKIREEVLVAMAEAGVEFDVTQYLPTSELVEKIQLRCLEYGVGYGISPLVKEFQRLKNYMKKTTPEKGYGGCFNTHCHFLQDGKIAICMKPFKGTMYGDLLSVDDEAFDVFTNDIIDIYDEELTGDKINELFSDAMSSCQFCEFGDNLEKFEWQGDYPYFN